MSDENTLKCKLGKKQYYGHADSRVISMVGADEYLAIFLVLAHSLPSSHLSCFSLRQCIDL